MSVTTSQTAAFPYKCFAAAWLFACGSAAALAVDLHIARCAVTMGLPGDIRKLVSVSEVFAHGMGVGLILLAVVVLDPTIRRRIPRVLFCAYGAGAAAQLCKQLVPRLRPSVFTPREDVWQTFLGRAADSYAQLHQLAERDIHAFPSGHSATAVGLAFGLAWLYPRGRWLFAGYAGLAMLQRIDAGAHFLSDTLAGTAVACLVAGVCWSNRGLNSVFARLEQGQRLVGQGRDDRRGTGHDSAESKHRHAA